MTRSVKLLAAVALCAVAALVLLGTPLVAKDPQTLTPVADRPLAPALRPQGAGGRGDSARGLPGQAGDRQLLGYLVPTLS